MKQFLTINDNGDMLNIDMIAAITPTRNGCTIPGFQQMPLPTPVCSHSLECNGCPYPRHGFLCWSTDGTCLRTRMNKINKLEKKPTAASTFE